MPELLLALALIYVTIYGSILGYNGINELPLIGVSVCYVYILVIFGCCFLLFLGFSDFLWYGLIISGSFKIDNLAIFSKVLIGVASIFFIFNVTLYLKFAKINHFEYPLIIVFAILGLYLLCSSNDLMFAYLAIEIQSLAFYILAAFKRRSGYSIDSGLKYFVLGSLSSVLFLFGTSIIYGSIGSIQFNIFGDLLTWDFASKNSILFAVGKGSICFTLDKILNETLHLNLVSEVQLSRILDKFNVLKSNNRVGDLDLYIFSKILNEDFFRLKKKWSDQLSKSNMDILDFSWNKKIKSCVEYPFFSSFEDAESSSTYSALNSISETSLHRKMIKSHFTFISNRYIKLVYCDYFWNMFNKLTEYSQNDYLIDYSFLTEYSLVETTIDVMSWTWYRNSGIRTDLIDYSLNNDDNDFAKNKVFFLNKFFPALLSDKSNPEIEHYILTKITKVLTYIICYYEPYGYYRDYSFGFWRIIEPGLIFILTGIFLKLALAPFHSWAIDVYEGSPSSSSFFFAVISKLGIFILLLRVCYSSFYSYISSWQYYCIILAVFSIFVGSVAGLEQRKLKSLLAYSSVSHGGYSILSFSSGSFEGIQMVLNYLFIYTLSGLCVWSVILILNVHKKSCNNNKTISDVALLIKSNPVFSYVFLIGLFSMAGVPPTAGFLAKVGVILVIVGSGFYIYSMIAVISSMFSTFYYIRLIKISNFENKLVGKLYKKINSNITDLLGFLTILTILIFANPSVLFFWSYKTILLFQ